MTYTYNVKRALSGTGAFTTIATGVTGTTYPDTSGSVGVSYDYVVTAVSAAESGHSGPMSATSQAPPPRTNDHDEGLLDGSCSCGSISGGPSAWTLVLALAALAAVFRRR